MSPESKLEVAYPNNDTEFMGTLHHALLCAQAEIKLYGHRHIGILYPDSEFSTAYETAAEELDQADYMNLDIAVDDSGSGTLEAEDIKLVQTVLDTKQYHENELAYEAMIDKLTNGTFDTSQEGRNQGSGATREDARIFKEQEEEYEAMIDGIIQGTYDSEHYGRSYDSVVVYSTSNSDDEHLDGNGHAEASEKVGERLSEELEYGLQLDHRSNAPSPDEMDVSSSHIQRGSSEESFV
ncbi:hypothetical protein GLAREA_04934 [Glarea lozoyensis ATCC 20868]|uniref:Uncharacterized protein n=2 Tax=Glarea lozoyensis TaxID=101852 RepID=S3DNU0_GLAL2|nr:uncharacterized protein GLAREA_04934 [Glarea lozoyensis ATCC 20868]EHL02068.1 hypothetical protein M7I_2023 [Glarea lozoyensis 74030]EPE28143.1 hypothetical protein GLAREA_04934 [Glarea lozoyensis ATCC 20868]